MCALKDKAANKCLSSDIVTRVLFGLSGDIPFEPLAAGPDDLANDQVSMRENSQVLAGDLRELALLRRAQS